MIKSKTLTDQAIHNVSKGSTSRAKVAYTKPVSANSGKQNMHSQSVDFSSSSLFREKGKSTATIQKQLATTFTSGFGLTMRSTGFSGTRTNTSFNGSFSASRGKKQPYVRGYGKYKLKDTTPMYDFTGGDTPWVNRSGVNNYILGQEQNFKVNHTTYDKEFDCARPVAHTKARKFCSMTRFIKDLEDNRIFQRWKMSAYRGTHR